MTVDPVTWVNVGDVAVYLGLPVVDPDDDKWLYEVTGAANQWAYERRKVAGYVDDPATVPSFRVHTGTVLYAASLYRQRGSVDSFASFDQTGAAVPFGTDSEIRKLLGIPRPQAV